MFSSAVAQLTLVVAHTADAYSRIGLTYDAKIGHRNRWSLALNALRIMPHSLAAFADSDLMWLSYDNEL